MAQVNFDATNVAPDAGRGDPMPLGWYIIAMTKSEMKPTAAGDGSFLLACTYDVLDGAFKGRKLFDQFNLRNNSPKAQEIAYAQFSAVCHATGRLQVNDSSELHNIPMKARVKIKPAEGQYEARNEITAYKNVNDPSAGNGTAATVVPVGAMPGPGAMPPMGAMPPAQPAQQWPQQPAQQQPWAGQPQMPPAQQPWGGQPPQQQPANQFAPQQPAQYPPAQPAQQYAPPPQMQPPTQPQMQPPVQQPAAQQPTWQPPPGAVQQPWAQQPQPQAAAPAQQQPPQAPAGQPQPWSPPAVQAGPGGQTNPPWGTPPK